MDALVPPPAPPPETNVEPPLLPAVLREPSAFLWLWSLPIGVLLLLNLQAYWLIEGNFDAAQREHATFLGAGNLANLLLSFALYFRAKSQAKHPRRSDTLARALGLVPILTQAGYLWWAAAWSDQVLPASVTSWIYPESRYFFNQFAFAMLPLFLGIFRLAGSRPAPTLGNALVLNLGLVLGGPVVLYVFGTLLWSGSGFNEIKAVAFAVAVVVLGIVLFVGLVRTLLLLLRRLQHHGHRGERAAIVTFAILLPLGGLSLNRTIPFPVDFQAWEVYALVLANAAILLFVSFRHARWPTASFGLLCATFPFSLYFFIVFLPFTPLSILAILAMGAGFLVLTPILLFVLHLHLLHQSRESLRRLHGNPRHLLTIGALCFLALPAFFTVRGVADKTALNAALDYLYTPTIAAENLNYPGSRTNLRRALSNHRAYKNGIYYPLLSDYYSWLVFDHLVLPDDKLDHLEKTFFGIAGSRQNNDPVRGRLNLWGPERSVRDRARMPRARPAPHTVRVDKLDLRMSPLAENAVATFTLTLENSGDAPAEFIQKLPLPAGVYVNGFRLSSNGQLVPGKIFEKKTALWVYTMIRDSERRDPGLLYYTRPDELELRVFPVNAHAPIVVEIDFLLPQSIALQNQPPPQSTPDPAALLAQLGNSIRPHIARDRGELAVAGLDALDLPAVEREPYLHLLIDRSSDNGYNDDLGKVLSTLREKFPSARLGRVTLVNHNVVDLVPGLTSLDDLAKLVVAGALEKLPVGGGLALDLGLARSIRQHRDLDLAQAAQGTVPPRPIFVIVSRRAAQRATDFPLTENWRDLLPSLELNEVGSDRTFVVHLQQGGPATPLLRVENVVRPLLANRTAWFAVRSHQPSLMYWSPEHAAWTPVADALFQPETTAWARATALQQREVEHGRSPGGSSLDLKALVRASRETGLLLPATSYIVVENSAQWRMLELSEQQKLDQNASLAFRETPAPPALSLGIGLALWLALRARHRRRAEHRRLIPCGAINST